MQNIYYFTPITFFPHPLSYPYTFTHPQITSVMPHQENGETPSQSEIPNNVSSQNCRTEPSAHDSSDFRASTQFRILTKSEKNGRNLHGKKQDEEFKLLTKPSNGIVYKKKNTQSNIINQTLSFLSTNKSKTTVLKFFNNNQQKVQTFYTIMEKIKKGNKKYINRKFMRKMVDSEGDLFLKRAMNKAKGNLMEISEVKKLIRILILKFLREEGITTLLTSNKISKTTLPQHFWRKRQILTSLFGGKYEQA